MSYKKKYLEIKLRQQPKGFLFSCKKRERKNMTHGKARHILSTVFMSVYFFLYKLRKANIRMMMKEKRYIDLSALQSLLNNLTGFDNQS